MSVKLPIPISQTNLSYFPGPLMEQEVESGYNSLCETAEKYLNHSGYTIVELTELFSGLMAKNSFPDAISFIQSLQEHLIENDEDNID